MAFGPYFLLAAAIIAAVAAWTDRRTGHMPDWLTLGPLALAPVAHAVAAGIAAHAFEPAAQAAGFSVLGAVVCAAIPLGLYFGAEAIGFGDVKLFAALGALLGTLVGVEAEFYAFMAATVIQLGYLAYHGKLFHVLGNTLTLAVNPFLPRDRRREIPKDGLTWARFGPAIFIGTAAAAVLHWRQP
jgi:prepilin peptidase CpaA